MNGSVGCGAPENKFIRIFQAEADDVAILDRATLHLFSVQIEAAAMPPVFQIPAIPFGNQRGALTGDAPVVQLQVISGTAAAPNEKRRFRQAGDAP